MKTIGKKQITLEDVAAAAGVTKTTVSQVLRNLPGMRFGQPTRDRVMAKAKELNYRPNFFAAQIYPHNRKMVMLGVDSLEDPFTGTLTAAFEQEVSAQGYNLLMGAFHGKTDPEFLESVVGEHGVLLMAVVGYASRKILPDEMLVDLAARGIHVVTIARPAPAPTISEVSYDHEAAMEELLEAVVCPGINRIWLLGDLFPRVPDDVGAIRNGAAFRYLVKKGLADKVTRVEMDRAENNFDSGFRTVERALTLYPYPDLVVCPDDSLALGGIQALEQVGLKVGHDVAVTGFNDQSMSAFGGGQSLTTVRVPMAAMGTAAARMIMDLNEGRRTDPVHLILKTEVKLRESHRQTLITAPHPMAPELKPVEMPGRENGWL